MFEPENTPMFDFVGVNNRKIASQGVMVPYEQKISLTKYQPRVDSLMSYPSKIDHFPSSNESLLASQEGHT